MNSRNAALSAWLFFAIAAFVSGCGGNSPHPTQVSAPSGLAYSQVTIAAVVGQAVNPDTPTVSGTVTAYAVSPALPAGLTLDGTTGTISGMPGAVTAGASYTITASNISGATTATVQIAVTAASMKAPSGLRYPQTAINAYVGLAIKTDTPTVTGTVTGYTVNPALPAGLTLSTTTGAISGTPTAVTAAAAYTVTASNSGGTASTTIQIAVTSVPVAPSGLIYPQTTISAYVGQAIATDTPSVTGTVTGYAVNPALPAGLTLDATTGAISGTPTTVTVPASYTVTASNALGSATATVQIGVADAPIAPTALVYPQTTISTFVGRSITPNLPATAGGAMTSYTVDPALPAGLTIDPATGVVSGTPTAAAAQVSYAITGANVSGSVTANVTITVNQTPIILLGGSNLEGGRTLQLSNPNVFAESNAGVWELFNYASGKVLASGDAGNGGASFDPNISEFTPEALMAGPTLAIQVTGGIEIRSSAYGHVLGVVVSPGFGIGGNGLEELDLWQLASDGSYIALETSSGIYAYSPSGQLLFSRPGNYLQASANIALSGGVFAAPGQIQVAGGPANTSAVETIAVPSGASSVGAAYQGIFCTWFGDGSHFATGQLDNNSTSTIPVWIYSSASAQQAAMQLPGCGQPGGLGGWGNWLWVNGTTGQGNQSALSVYAIGSSTPAFIDSSRPEYIAAAGPTVALFTDNPEQINVIDLSGAKPVETQNAVATSSDYTVEFENYDVPYAAASGTEWVAALPVIIGDTDYFVSNEDSQLIVDGASLATKTPRYFGQGPIASMAGSSNTAAIATATQITWFDPTKSTPLGSVNTTSGQVELSSDGSMLAAATANNIEVALYSTSTGDLSSSFSFPSGGALQFDFSLSGDGGTLAATYGAYERGTDTSSYTVQVQSTRNNSVNWSKNYAQSLQLPSVISPDGTLVAVTEQGDVAPALLIYKNGALQATVSGQGLGWLDNGHLLAQSATGAGAGTGTVVYSPSGTILSTSPLAHFSSDDPLEVVNADTIYSPYENTIYSVSTGQAVWTSPYVANTLVGAVAGSYVVFESEGQVIAVPWQ